MDVSFFWGFLRSDHLVWFLYFDEIDSDVPKSGLELSLVF